MALLWHFREFRKSSLDSAYLYNPRVVLPTWDWALPNQPSVKSTIRQSALGHASADSL